MAAPLPDEPPREAPDSAGLKHYLKAALLFRWNVLFLGGSTIAALLTPFATALLPIVAAGELCYLAGLVSIPRFRAAIDAQVHQAGTSRGEAAAPPAAPSVRAMLAGLPADLRSRFERLHARCVEMRAIAAGVGGATPSASPAEEVRTPGLDRLLWLFLRLLLSKDALDQFLATLDEKQITTKIDQLKKDLATAQAGGDERIVRSLQDSLANAELRLDNFSRAKKNGEFVTGELDRIEGKIQALSEMAVNRQDPDFLSRQVDSAADSMRQTEKAVSELQHLTGLADQLQDPPPLLEANLQEVLRHDG
jgi:hypothetical protein